MAATCARRRLGLVLNEAHSGFHHTKVEGLIQRARLRYPEADRRRLDRSKSFTKLPDDNPSAMV